MSFNITNLKTALNGGSRANLFRVSISGVTSLNAASVYSILCKSASLPASSIGIVEVAYNAGRRFKMGGERTFADWTTTVLNDEDFTVRKSLEDWQAGIVFVDANSTTVGNRNGEDTRAIPPGQPGNDGTTVKIVDGTGNGLLKDPTIIVEQLNDEGIAVKRYQLNHCWPSDISSIDLSYDTTDTVEEFTVTWTYDYFTEIALTA